jgi:hypothetical protein
MADSVAVPVDNKSANSNNLIHLIIKIGITKGHVIF